MYFRLVVVLTLTAILARKFHCRLNLAGVFLSFSAYGNSLPCFDNKEIFCSVLETV